MPAAHQDRKSASWLKRFCDRRDGFIVQQVPRVVNVVEPPAWIFSRHFPSSRRARGGASARSGSTLSTAAMVSETSSPANSRCAVSISNSTTPKAQMSARLSTALPRACSGDMYAAVPRIMPRCGHRRRRHRRRARRRWLRGRAGSSAFASPKSSTFTVPSGRTLMFAGFRSRWMMPCSCAASSASAICCAIGSASSIGIGPCGDPIGQRRPLDQFHHERLVPPVVLQAIDLRDVRMVQRREDFGLALEARERSGSCAKSSGRTLRATSRLSFVSRARYTSPMPPAPIGAMTSYSPRRVPGDRATGCRRL